MQKQKCILTVSSQIVQLVQMIQFLGKGDDDMIEINPTSSQPIFEQIIAQIKMAVLKGLLKPGDSIPSVRKMALSLSVTPGTVAKAYGELERQQVIVTIGAVKKRKCVVNGAIPHDLESADRDCQTPFFQIYKIESA